LPYCYRLIHSLVAKLRKYSESNRNNPTFLILLGKKSIIIMGYLAIWDYLCSADDIVTRRDGYLFRVLQNSKITYRPHCPGTGGGAFNISNF
jgi:hypothetical protein